MKSKFKEIKKLNSHITMAKRVVDPPERFNPPQPKFSRNICPQGMYQFQIYQPPS